MWSSLAFKDDANFASEMATASSDTEPGGFFHPALPSPPASSYRSLSIEPPHLPQTRSHPLKSGSAKEGSVIYYLDNKLLDISRRYEKRLEEETQDGVGVRDRGDSPGYTGFGQLAQDLEAVIDVVWVTASRTIT